MKKISTVSNVVPIESPAVIHDGSKSFNHDFLYDFFEVNSEKFNEKEKLVESLQSLLMDLDRVSYQVMVMHYLKGLQLSEIAKLFNMAEDRIYKIYLSAVSFLRKELREK